MFFGFSMENYILTPYRSTPDDPVCDFRPPLTFSFFSVNTYFLCQNRTSKVPFHQESWKHDLCATFTSDVIQGQSCVISITPVRKAVQVYSFVFWIQHGKLHLTQRSIGQGSFCFKCPRFFNKRAKKKCCVKFVIYERGWWGHFDKTNHHFNRTSGSRVKRGRILTLRHLLQKHSMRKLHTFELLGQ